MLRHVDDAREVNCPYCFEAVALFVDPETRGTFVEDCEVCCRPWQVHVSRELDGSWFVTVSRAQ